MSCWSTSLLKAISASSTRLLIVLSTMNLISFGVGNPFPVSEVLGGPRLALLEAKEAKANSFMRKVGVPSIHECSPRKPDLPFSNTITGALWLVLARKSKKALTLVFIVEPVLAVTDPTGPRSLFTGNRRCVVKTNDHHGGLYPLERISVLLGHAN